MNFIISATFTASGCGYFIQAKSEAQRIETPLHQAMKRLLLQFLKNVMLQFGKNGSIQYRSKRIYYLKP